MINKISIFSFLVLILIIPISCNSKNVNSNNIIQQEKSETLEEVAPIKLNNDNFYQLALKAFKYSNPMEMNIETGNYFNILFEYFAVENKSLIKQIDVYEAEFHCYQNLYNNGLLIQEYSIYNEGVENNTYYLEYDDKNRLVKNTMWEYIYPDDNDKYKTEYERTIYYENEFLRTETISIIESGYKISIESSSGYNWVNDFIINNGLLIKVVVYDRVGVVNRWFDLEYDDSGYIQRITAIQSRESKVIYTENIVKREGLAIFEIERISYDQDVMYCLC